MTHPKKAKPAEYRPRKCKYCRLTFTPVVGPKLNRRNAETQKFCCKKCKDRYHHNGGMNWERFMERVESEVRKIVRRAFDDLKPEIEQTAIIAARIAASDPLRAA